MPPRPIVLAIVLFWLSMSGWLFYRDLWPSLRPGDPPPYVIDLADEARRQAVRTRWFIYRGEKRIGLALTWVSYEQVTDTFELHSEIPKLDLGGIGPLRIEARRLEGMYRVSREGDLREVSAELYLDIVGLGLLGGSDAGAKIKIAGLLADGTFTPTGSLIWNGHQEPLPLEPVPVSGRGNVLDPLHPVGRIQGLRPGQHWRAPVVDPLSDSLRAMVQRNPVLQPFVKQDAGIRSLQAEVLPETHMLLWQDEEIVCLVVQYSDREITTQVWVRESDGTVLRQEASIGGEKLVLERD
jgi:hypothetical protein